ncbi:MAG: PE-PPE domain-containing protein [Mycobacteriaceae bacterium]|nr:PE-PPE domain-containing protein [Mycobacteriaceae bacterium]
MLIANPNRPNGGILERFAGVYIPILGVTFSGATPTNTGMTTVDVARQYDGWADWPTNPLNLLADINAGFGIYYLHGNYIGVGTPLLQGQYGDTTYYLIPTPVLPMLMPLEQIPVVGPALAATVDPVLRVLVETGYNRTINPGQPTPANFLYFPNPVQTLVDLVIAIPTGVDNGISTFTGVRPLGTPVPGPYGVGGPPVNTGCGTPPCGAPTPYAPLNPSASTPTTVAASTVSTPDPKPTNAAVVDTPAAIDTPSKVAPTTNPPVSPFTIKPTDGQLTQNPSTGNKPTGSGLPALNKLVPSLTELAKLPTITTHTAKTG